MKWVQAIGFGSFILAWLTRSSQDGKISQDELAELIEEACRTFDIDVEIEVPALAPLAKGAVSHYPPEVADYPPPGSSEADREAWRRVMSRTPD